MLGQTEWWICGKMKFVEHAWYLWFANKVRTKGEDVLSDEALLRYSRMEAQRQAEQGRRSGWEWAEQWPGSRQDSRAKRNANVAVRTSGTVRVLSGSITGWSRSICTTTFPRPHGEHNSLIESHRGTIFLTDDHGKLGLGRFQNRLQASGGKRQSPRDEYLGISISWC